MTLEGMLSAIFPPNPNEPPRPSVAQRTILQHPSGPGWVLAGPGSGKTDTLALLIMRLVFVDGVKPESIFATTFTEKAARNLDDRISDYRGRLSKADPKVEEVDLSRLRLGTLHGLCNDVLQEYRSENYLNVRLMDKFETAMFINEHVRFVRLPGPQVRAFWTEFSYLLGRRWNPGKLTAPQWTVASDALATLFGRIADDNVNVTAMRNAGGQFEKLADLYDEYLAALKTQYRCDFAQLLKRFLQFLDTPAGSEFKNGSQERASLQWILVDEYQDTNLVQEAIYMNLAAGAPHNIVVVGDDDQAMYRFRGASVECMVTFDEACSVYLGIDKKQVLQYPLVENYRSHPDIVEFCEAFITSFPEMQAPAARAPGKQPLVSSSGITGDYRALGIIEGKKAPDAPAAVAQVINDLFEHGVIQDYSQCCILLKSTKEGPQNAGPFVDALRQLGIEAYNPRSGNFLKQVEVLTLLGGIAHFVDPSGTLAPQPIAAELHAFVRDARAAFTAALADHPFLRGWFEKAILNVAAHPNERLQLSLQDILYLLLAMEPFRQWQTGGPPRIRLAKLTSLIETYASLPVAGHENVRRGSLQVAADGSSMHTAWVRQFYDLFYGYLNAQGVNDEEDEDVIVPHGAVPIMTMHQSKGLEFPFVFVGHMAQKHSPSAAHEMEDVFAAFPGRPDRVFQRPDQATRAKLDMIRQYYVAYSRAERGLMFVGMRSHFDDNAVPCGATPRWLRSRVNVL